ncbi:MAG: succinylglutamate desuccinylase/aspartoacylase family protein [Lactobacillaceae bacterium]|jgi:predicted deacylase|nr:succinylglutamate desuccinylase/aspartoacylase family protein [Lactobacillaceae bacterium]
MLRDISFESGVKGPKILILGAVHGNETAGPRACERLIKEIEKGNVNINKGRLILVPITNSKAYKDDVRQIEENLNRVIKKWENPISYEQKLGVEVAKKIDECDYVLDVHSTHNAGDIPFSFLDYPTFGNMEIVKALDVEYVLSGWPEVYGTQNEIKDFSTETYAHAQGKNGITLECGYHKDNAATELAYNSIINLLKTLKMIEGEPSYKDKKIVRMTDIIIKEKAGKLAENFKHFDFIPKNAVIARYDDGEELRSVKDCYMIIPNPEAKIGAEWYYLGE